MRVKRHCRIIWHIQWAYVSWALGHWPGHSGNPFLGQTQFDTFCFFVPCRQSLMGLLFYEIILFLVHLVTLISLAKNLLLPPSPSCLNPTHLKMNFPFFVLRLSGTLGPPERSLWSRRALNCPVVLQTHCVSLCIPNYLSYGCFVCQLILISLKEELCLNVCFISHNT